jgi:hypothetical protein
MNVVSGETVTPEFKSAEIIPTAQAATSRPSETQTTRHSRERFRCAMACQVL